MTRLEDDFTLDMRVTDAFSACHGAVMKLRWKVEELDAHRIVARAGGGFGERLTRIGNPSRIAVLLAGAGDAQTRVNVKGRSSDSGRCRGTNSGTT